MTMTLNQAVDEKVPAGKLLTMTLDQTGHTATLWDVDDPIAMAEVNQLFDKLVKENGYTAYSVAADGGMEAGIKAVDATAEKLIFSPALAGG